MIIINVWTILKFLLFPRRVRRGHLSDKRKKKKNSAKRTFSPWNIWYIRRKKTSSLSYNIAFIFFNRRFRFSPSVLYDTKCVFGVYFIHHRGRKSYTRYVIIWDAVLNNAKKRVYVPRDWRINHEQRNFKFFCS